MKIAIVCLVLMAVSYTASAATSEEVLKSQWDEFKALFNKTYSKLEEEKYRMKVWMENTMKIANHNKMYGAGLKSYAMKMNHFGDLFHHEFIKVMNGYKPALKKSNGSTYLSPNHVNLPKSVDWREKGYVTPVKDQGHCGSCWAFSTTGSLEGQHFRKTGKMVSLSEQNLVDCSTSFGNNGCNGGLMDNAFKYIKANEGIDTEDSYPYEAQDDTCRFNKQNVGADDTGFVDIPSGDENKLQEAVATIGPVSVAIDASHESFQFYSHGIYDEKQCSSTELDHGVLVVGYGEGRNWLRTQKYWIVKNSWGEKWGDQGYIKMARNHNNMCGIATAASYPLV